MWKKGYHTEEMEEPFRILIADHDNTTVEIIRNGFRHRDFHFVAVDSGERALDAVQNQKFDAIICELHLPGIGGLALMSEMRRSRIRIPVLIVASEYDSRTAIETVKAGAFDFLAKPLDCDEMIRSLSEAASCSRKMGDPVEIDPLNTHKGDVDALVGNSRVMLAVYKKLGRLSPTPVTVLVRGETGTGKELVARALYQHGHRAHKSFITINCAAIPENLLESELFGHEKGSFTGAISTRIGKFEQANNATLFLDEIGDLDLALQAKLLRFLQERQFQRVGGSEEIAVDVRIIAATHRPLEQMIADGTFREDLFYRLNVATIELPPLRYRDGDIPLLAHFFVSRLSVELGLPPVGITANGIEALEAAPWKGNVRQLQNVIRKCVLGARGFSIDRAIVEEVLEEHRPFRKPSSERGPADEIRDLCIRLLKKAQAGEIEDVYQSAIETLEPILLEETLRLSNGNLSQASRWLGISRLTLREKLKSHKLR